MTRVLVLFQVSQVFHAPVPLLFQGTRGFHALIPILFHETCAGFILSFMGLSRIIFSLFFFFFFFFFFLKYIGILRIDSYFISKYIHWPYFSVHRSFPLKFFIYF